MHFVTRLEATSKGAPDRRLNIVTPPNNPVTTTGQGKELVGDCEEIHKNFCQSHCHIPTSGHVLADAWGEARTGRIIHFIKRGLPAATAEAIAFCFYGNPLEQGGNYHD
jgi:hypothetical protein